MYSKNNNFWYIFIKEILNNWLKKSIYREHVTESLKNQTITQNNTSEHLKHDLFHFWELEIITKAIIEIISQIWDLKFSSCWLCRSLPSGMQYYTVW